ncbi:glycoside hydrolase family 6 protein [Allorhizocola rhizosphaerae]|uniref:glycoside hydrolase family 6 protein n=1 Tax=Allorhizocola rhizosphaerae TaxID=1872709 RepID=UPI0013C2A64E|nr:glycoside hydrolase family 6 protein [Allorhizocola rhizosphaerae]
MKLAILLAIVAAVLAACARADRPPVTYAPLVHPFKGANLFHDIETAAAAWARANGDPDWVKPITDTPQAIWLTAPRDLDRLPAVIRAAASQRALLVLVTYYVPNRDCAGAASGAPDPDSYLAWIDRLADTLGTNKAVIIMEPDAIAADCYTDARAQLLREATYRLARAGHHLYLDAGHPKWRQPGQAAERLIASGIQAAQGFTVNVSNRQTTADSDVWAREVSKMTGDREFLIDTSRNGLGPPPGDEWCNPARQGLGERPTTDPGTGAAAHLWVKRPGESDGHCGGESTFGFSPRQAATLIANAQWVPENLRRRAGNERA